MNEEKITLELTLPQISKLINVVNSTMNSLVASTPDSPEIQSLKNLDHELRGAILAELAKESQLLGLYE